MAQTVRDSFLDLERHRQLLEENIDKLRVSLRHWQTWEAEYEGLKEEILAAKPTPNRDQLVVLAGEYEGDLVTKKEIEEILGPVTRSSAQVVNLLDRRLDYVQQNVRTVQKQVDTAEIKLAAATVISTPDVRNEEGLPLTEIIEELDQEGNVISSHTSTPGSAQPQLLEVLQKAGVQLPKPSSDLDVVPAVNDEMVKPAPKSLPAPRNKVEGTPEMAKRVRKGVKFTEDTKSGPESKTSQTAKRIEEIMSIAKQADSKLSGSPIIPTNESPEDAALRREMLQYGMSEVGAVVAELNVEDGSDWSDEDYEDDISSLDDEDAFGRSTTKIVDDELRQRMIELEERLGVRMMENIGKKASDYDVVQEGIGRVTINRHQEGTATHGIQAKQEAAAKSSSETETPAAKKSVRFSEDLDISPALQVPVVASTANKSTAAPIGDIVERSAPAHSTTTLTPQKKTSRFKDSGAAPSTVVNGPLAPSRATQHGQSLSLFPAQPSSPKSFSQPIQFTPASENMHTVPTGPEGRTLATQIIEREVPLNPLASGPDELDPQLLHQEVATEYHRIRNRMIQRQGGFLKEEESEIVPFTEEEGGPKKISRFKAARLSRS